MKDYYRILGVKKDATEEEIRNSWAQLVKKFHPDKLEEGDEEDKRLKEINEAYQVLKHSSTRAEYDLKRIYEQKGRGFKETGGLVFIIALVGFIFLGASYIKWNQPLSPSSFIDKSITSDPLSPPMKTLFNPDPVDSFLKVNLERVSRQKDNPSTPLFQDSEKTVPSAPLLDKVVLVRNEPTDSIPQSNPIPIHTIGIQSPEAKERSTSEEKGSTEKPISERANPSLPIAQSLHLLSHHPDKSMASDDQFQVAQVTPPSLLTTEEEVRKFFLRYVELYSQKNLEGFLSLFSPKAIQNQKDGLEKIKELYTHFFNNSKEIRYRIDGMKIEIYQNAVEVKARYEILQVTKRNDEKLWKGDIRWVLVKEGGDLKVLSIDYQHQKSS